MAKRKDDSIKPTWIVCLTDGFPLLHTDDGNTIEHRTEQAALKAAKEHVLSGDNDEAWIFKLSHVVSRPPVEPVVDVID